MTNYDELITILPNLIEGHENVTILANSSALLNEYLDNINWVGFYFINNNELILGPFQGKVACSPIKFGRGVCGTCIKEAKTIVVDDVHKFSGHIACDSASNSEICIPIYNNDKLYGLLDIDSPIFNRFSDLDKKKLEEISNIISKSLKKETLI